MTRLCGYGLFLLLLLPGCASLSKREPEEQPPAESQQTPSGNAALSGGIDNQAGADEADNKTGNQEFEMPWGSLADWAMVIVTLLAVRAAFKTLEVLQVQTDAAKANADAALIAARAAESNAKTSERHLFLSLRARVGVFVVTVHDFGPEKERTYLSVVVQNFGGKGARLERFVIQATTGELPAEPDYASAKWIELGVPLEPSTRQNLIETIGLIPKDKWNMINDESRSTRLKIYGAVRYNAGFGGADMELSFCRVYDPKLTRFTGRVTFATAGGSKYNYERKANDPASPE